MKKFLVILLIAVIACETVEQDLDLESWWSNLWDKITGAVKKAWNWLTSSGVLNTIKSLKPAITMSDDRVYEHKYESLTA